MKRLLFALLLLVSLVVSTTITAQSTSARFTDRYPSYANLGLSYRAYTEVVGFDSIKLAPNTYNNHYKVTITTDSCILTLAPTTPSYFLDRMTIVINNTVALARPVYFYGGTGGKTPTTRWLMTASGTTTLTVAASKKAIIQFIFDGANWCETGRAVQ